MKVPDVHYHCIHEAMAMNELTASDLKDILTKRFGADKVQHGVRTITMVRNGQAIREANKTKRLDWCSDS